MDLSSSSASIALGSAMFGGAASVSINVGGSTESFKAGQVVTPAEFVAIQQVLSNNKQTLILDAHGIASGGTFSLNVLSADKAAELVIPSSVTAVDNFSSNRSVSFSGDLINYGSIDGISTSNSVHSGSISALDIINESGATITTNLASMARSVTTGDQKVVSLALSAGNDLSNSGTISSSSGLTLSTASGGILNTSVIGAASGITLSSANGNLANAGSIKTIKGDINIASPSSPVDININAAGGVFSAAGGNINVRDASYIGSNNINISGGDFLSKNLNLYGGAGSIDGSVGQVSGNLNTSGGAAHFYASTGVLTLGDNQLSGDPTFVNANGNIVINGAVTANQAITIVAAGNITATGAAYISTANSTGPAGATTPPSTDITLIAGANVVASGAGSTFTLPSGTALPAGQTVTVNFSASGSGGNIDLSKSTFTGPIINTSSTIQLPAANQSSDAGNVTLIAVATPTNSTSGRIVFPSGTQSINTSSLYGNSGNVTLIAGNSAVKSTTPSIIVGSITSASPSGVPFNLNGGNISIVSGSAVSSNGNAVVFDSTGSITSGNTIQASATLASGYTLLTGTMFAGSANVSIQNGGSGPAGGIGQKGIGKIYAQNIELQAGVLGIGTKTASILTGTLEEPLAVTLNSGGSVFATNTGSFSVSGTGGSGATFQVASLPDPAGACDISLGNISSASGAPLAQINIIGAMVPLTANSPLASVISQAGTSLVATNVALSAGIGGKGAADFGGFFGAGQVDVTATNLSVNAQNGFSTIIAAGPINLLNSNLGTVGIFTLATRPDASNSGTITLAGKLSAGEVALDSSENAGGVGGVVQKVAGLSATILQITDTNGASPSFTGDGTANIGTATKPLLTNIVEGNFATGGAVVNIKNTNARGFEQGSGLDGGPTAMASGGTFTLTTTGPLTVTGLNAQGNVILTAGSAVNLGGPNIGQDIVSVNGNVNVTSGASGGNINVLSAVVSEQSTTGIVTLTAGGTGSILTPVSQTGTPFDLGIVEGATVVFNGKGTVSSTLFGSPFQILASNLESNVTGNTNIFMANTGSPLTITAAKSTGQFNVTTQDPIVVSAPITSATSINLVITGQAIFTPAGITYSASIGGAKTTNILLSALSTGSITGSANAVLTASQSVTLITGGGTIGTASGPAVPLQVATGTLSATTIGASGTVNINALSTKTGTTVTNSASDSDFTLTGTGNISISNLQSIAGNISVTTSGALLQTTPGAVIAVGSSAAPAPGSETLSLVDNYSKGGSILIGAGSDLSTYVNTPGLNAGTITLQTGTPGTVTPSTQTNVTVNGAAPGSQALFGANGIVANAPANIINLSGANVIMDTGGLPASHITLGGNTTFTADPPVLGSTQASPVAASSTAATPALAPAPGQAATPTPAASVSSPAPSVYSSNSTSISSSPLAGGVATNVVGTSTSATSDGNLSIAALSGGINAIPGLLSALPLQRTGDLSQTRDSSAWLSDCELQSGEIAAAVISDQDLAIASRETIALDYTVEKRGLPEHTGHMAVGRTISLRRGSYLVAPQSDTTLSMPAGKINVSANSLALVIAFNGGFAIYNLDDSSSGSVQVVAGGKTLVLSPGEHASIAPSDVRDFAEINPAQAIGHCTMSEHKLESGLKVYRSQFSIVQAMLAVQPVKQMLVSNSPAAQKAARHLLKTTAILMQINGGSEYKQILRPTRVAWQQ